jgi:hypothetical protein
MNAASFSRREGIQARRLSYWKRLSLITKKRGILDALPEGQ